MKIKFGMIVTDGVNKIGGHVISSNHYGRYARTLVIPNNPQTTPQQDRRAAQAFLTSNWKNLTLDQQNLWIDETNNYPRTDALGNTYYLTGQTLYISLNLNLWRIGEPYITSPVTKRIPDSWGRASIDLVGPDTKFQINLDAEGSDTLCKILLFASPSVSPGKFYCSTLRRSFAVVAQATTLTYDVLSDFLGLGYHVTTGQKIFIKAQPIDTLSGCAGVPDFYSAIVI